MQDKIVFDASRPINLTPRQGICYSLPDDPRRALCVAAKTNPFKVGEIRLITNIKSLVKNAWS